MKQKLVVCMLMFCARGFSQSADFNRGRTEILGFIGTAVEAAPFSLGTNAKLGGGVEAAYDLKRYLAVTGNYALNRIGDNGFCLFAPCASFPDEDVHEFMGGARLSLPGHRASPYILGTLGGVRLVNFNLANSNNSTEFAYGVGIGVNVGITHRTGINLDLRGIHAVSSDLWLVRPTAGFFFRF